MKAESWEFQPQKVEFLEYKSKSALKILPGAGPVVLKAPEFTACHYPKLGFPIFFRRVAAF